MSKRMILAAAVVLSVAAWVPMHGQNTTSKKPASDSAKEPFDPHDLSGYWQFFNRIPGQGIYATVGKDHPPFTPLGQKLFDANKPSYGPRMVQLDNDPIQHCRPTGIPRILFYPQPFEIVQDPNRVFMFFEREHAWREIWTDGRSHPKDPEPTFMGDSIGKWDGDTFVVDSVGFNDRTWLDFYGFPRSEALHLTERWRRVDAGILSLQLIVDDPMIFTKPWVGDTKLYSHLTGDRAFMEELFCVAEDEEAFTERIRNPARGIKDTPTEPNTDEKK